MKAKIREIIPGEGLGALKFGMTRNMVLALIGEPDEKETFSYSETESEMTESWEYLELGISLNFDEEDDWKLVLITVYSDYYLFKGEAIVGEGRAFLEEIFDQEGINDVQEEDWSSEESPKHILLESDALSINFWFSKDVLDEVQLSPQFIDDETIKWPKL